MRVPAALLAGLLLTGCFAKEPAGVPCDAAPPAPDPAWQARAPRVEVSTDAGRFLVELYEERAPRTVANFLDLASAGLYDGTLFHRVDKGFVIQGGDPDSKDADPANDGLGGPGYTLRDEFNPSLRHDGAGVVSMASAGPDLVGSQFFVTLAAAPRLDDRHSAFGRVVAGMDVVRAIGDLPTDAGGRPTEALRILRVNETQPQTYAPEHRVGLHAVVDAKLAAPGRDVTFAVLLKNDGNVRDAPALHAAPPDGWTCRVSEAPLVPAGTARVVFLTLQPPEGATGEVDVPLRAVSGWAGTPDATASVRVVLGELGREVRDGDRVTANYAGLLPDGRVFDTTLPTVAHSDAQPKLDTPGGYRAPARFEPFTFTVGSGVIDGFSEMARGARVGETVTARIAAADAYAEGNMYDAPLVGRDLVFELEILDAR